jgi:hypothetical protein
MKKIGRLIFFAMPIVKLSVQPFFGCGLVNGLLWMAILLLAGPSFGVHKIRLCTDFTATKQEELFNDLLELPLLMNPQVETRPCEDKIFNGFTLRQHVMEIADAKDDKNRLEVVSALYDPKGRVIFSQLEFIERPSRKRLNERAQALSANIIKAIKEDQEVDDPFAELDLWEKKPSGDEESTPESLPLNRHDREQGAPFSPPAKEAQVLTMGFFLGMEWFYQSGFGGSFNETTEFLATKPFLIIGSSFFYNFSSALSINGTLRGAAMPVALVRPLELKTPLVDKPLKMVDTDLEFAWRFFSTMDMRMSVGLMLSGLFLDSNLKERVPLAKLSSYWQFRQGINVVGTYFIRVFDTHLSLELE